MVWDFSVPQYHNYFAGGVINHNSTKTTMGVFEAIMVYTGMVPPSMQGLYPHKIPTDRPRHVRIIVSSYTKHWPETIRPLLLSEDYGMLPEAWSNWNNDEKMFTGPDGSFLSIVAVDPHENVDPNVLRGPLMDHTLIDEINQQMVFTESLARGVSLKDGPRTVTCVYCPQEGFKCWTFDMFYRACYDPITKQRLPKSQCHSSIFTQKVTMRDNPSISDSERNALIATYKPWEVAFRVDGEYSDRATNPFFNMELLLRWERANFCTPGVPCRMIEKNIDTDKGIFEGELEVADGGANEAIEPIWRVWGQPIEGEKYILAGDLGEGNDKSDWTVLDVWKVSSMKLPVQVAQLRTRAVRAGGAGIQACCMAHFYGDCLVATEQNTTAGGMCIDRIRNYKNLYKRVRTDKQRRVQTDKLGWHTDVGNRGPMLDNLYKYCSQWGATLTKAGEPYCGVNSHATLQEFMGFEERIQHDKEGHYKGIEWGARAGAHDDTVMCMAIALQITRTEYSKITACKLKKPKVPSPPLTDFESKANEGASKAFRGMKKVKSLSELSRKAHPERYHARQSDRRIPWDG